MAHPITKVEKQVSMYYIWDENSVKISYELLNTRRPHLNDPNYFGVGW